MPAGAGVASVADQPVVLRVTPSLCPGSTFVHVSCPIGATPPGAGLESSSAAGTLRQPNRLAPQDAFPMTFTPGLDLSEVLFRTAVEPLLAHNAPGLSYAAGLIGAGSDVLGFDTERSTD